MKKHTALEIWKALESSYFADRPGWGRDKFTAAVRHPLKARTMKRLLKWDEPSQEKKRAFITRSRNFALLIKRICRDMPFMAPEIGKSLWEFARGRPQSVFALRDTLKDFAKKLPHRPGSGRAPALTAQQKKELFEDLVQFLNAEGLDKANALARLSNKYDVSTMTIRRELAKSLRESGTASAQKEFPKHRRPRNADRPRLE